MKINQYVKKGMKVAELFHGEKTDILENLSELVGESGKVYGIDYLNPCFAKYLNKGCKNIELIKQKFPSKLPENLDALVIREFLYAYDRKPAIIDDKEVMVQSDNPESYKSIDDSLKSGGYLIIAGNEYEKKQGSAAYNHYIDSVNKNLKYEKLNHTSEGVIFKKSMQGGK